MQTVRTLQGDVYEFKEGTTEEEMRAHLVEVMKVSLDDWVIHLKPVDDEDSDKSKGSDKSNEWLAWVDETPPSDEWVRMYSIQTPSTLYGRYHFLRIRTPYTAFDCTIDLNAAYKDLPCFRVDYSGDTPTPAPMNTAYASLQECMEAECPVKPSKLLLNQVDTRLRHRRLVRSPICAASNYQLRTGIRDYNHRLRTLKATYPAIAWNDWFEPRNRYGVFHHYTMLNGFETLLTGIPVEQHDEVRGMVRRNRYGYLEEVNDNEHAHGL